MSTDSSRQRRKDSGTRATPQLSCELCRERKVRCDKLEPCTTCILSGIECSPIYRQRLPRGRHSQPKSANVEKQNHHSQLNRTASPVPQSNSTPLPGGALLTTDEADAITVATSVVGQVPKPSVNDWGEIRPLATPVSVQEAIRPNQEIEPALWAFPTTAATSDGRYYGVPATRRGDLLWSIPYEEHEVDCAGSLPVVSPPDSISFQNPASKSSGASAGIFGTLCFGGSTGNSSSTLPDQDTPIALRRLGQVYLDHVDPVVKILHRPSLRKLLQHDSTYLGYPEHHTSVIALSSAICYVATCSLSETECRDMFQTSKITVVTQYRQACETSLDRAEVLVTEDMTALQAFVLYLVGRRAEGQEKVVWSLIPLAIRLAKGMSLHTDAAMTTPMRYRTESFFDQQMRKRLWLTICVLDLQASFAHGSEPLVPVAEVSSALEGLRHLDDADFDEQTTDEIPQREDLTCATLAFVTYHAQVSGRFLNYDGQEQQRQCEDVDLPSSGGDSVVRRPSSSASSIHVSGRKDSLPNPFSSMAREGALAAFERKAFELIRFCDPEASRQAWLTWHKTQILVSTTRLAALRPFPSILTSQERVNDVDLQLAFRVLEKVRLMQTDSRYDGLQWYTAIPWHALAVAITGCYRCTKAKLLRERWPLVEQVWHLQQTQAGSGGSSGHTALATPLRRMMLKIRERLGSTKLVGGGNQNAISNRGNPISSKTIPPGLFSSATLQENQLATLPLSKTSVTSANHLMTPASASRMDGGAIAAGPSFPSSDHNQYHQPQQSSQYNQPGSRSHHLNPILDSFPSQGLEDDSSGQSQQDSLFDGMDLQDEDMVMMGMF